MAGTDETDIDSYGQRGPTVKSNDKAAFHWSFAQGQLPGKKGDLSLVCVVSVLTTAQDQNR